MILCRSIYNYTNVYVCVFECAFDELTLWCAFVRRLRRCRGRPQNVQFMIISVDLREQAQTLAGYCYIDSITAQSLRIGDTHQDVQTGQL